MVHLDAAIFAGDSMARPRGQKHPVRLSVSLDEDDHAAISRLASDMNLSAAWIVRRAVAEFVERHSDGAQSELPLLRRVSKEY
ncbi:ribbon-helix-helix protein, CopG family [Neorhizobium sp. IRAMC:178]|uniref:ribbon-helix-helix protein, CopG family n=1 Tax=Neorhizobium tunisiense TaxID=3144793 RepID=UPI0031F6A8FD